MRDGDAKHLPGLRARSKRRGRVFHADVHVAADEAQSFVAHQRAGEKPGFAKDLKAITNSEHEASGTGEARDGVHYGREAGDCPSAQVVAIRKTARQDDRVKAADVL